MVRPIGWAFTFPPVTLRHCSRSWRLFALRAVFTESLRADVRATGSHLTSAALRLKR